MTEGRTHRTRIVVGAAVVAMLVLVTPASAVAAARSAPAAIATKISEQPSVRAPGIPGRSERDQIQVVVAFYPLAEAVQRVGGDRVKVTNLTPAGAEPHDLELTTDQVDQLQDARLVVVMGKGFQPAAEDVAANRDRGTVVILREIGQTRSDDPHVWLDPVRMRDIVDLVERTLVKVDRKHAADFERRAQSFDAELATLDADYRAGLAQCARRTIVTAHDAFGYLAERYGLRQEAIAGLSPDAEPNPKRLAELADIVRRNGVTTVFAEELVSPKVAETLAREAGVTTDVLNPLEGLTKRERARGDDYTSVMRANLAKLRAALRCS